MIASLSINKSRKVLFKRQSFAFKSLKSLKSEKKNTYRLNGHKIFILQPIATIFEYV